MAKKDLSDIIAIMKFCGQWNDFTGSTFFVKFAHNMRHIFEIFSCILSIVAIYVAGFVNSLGSIMYFSMMGTLVVVQSLHFFYNHKVGEKLIKGFQDILKKHEHKWEDKIFHKETDLIWKVIKFYMCTSIGFMIFYLAAPVVIDTYLIFINTEIDSHGYRVPLPLQGFLDPFPARNINYYLTVFIGELWAVISIFSNIGCQSLLCLFSVYLSVEIKILCIKLKIFGEQENEKYLLKNTPTSDIEISKSKLKELIIHHQEIMSIAHNMTEYFGFPFAFQNTMTSICICLMLFQVLMNSGQDAAVMFTNIFILFIMFVLAGVTCSLGQKIENQCSKVFETLYELPWYKQDPELRKYINMMLRQAVRHMKIHYKGRSALNLRTLMQILNTSYSYFMVLKSTV